MNVDLNKLAAPIALLIALSGVVGSGYVALEKIDRLETQVASLLSLTDDNMNSLIRLESVGGEIDNLWYDLDALATELADHIKKPKKD
mgnify:CR=1 FL=1